ncbi:MAG: metallophosphoesterase [Candidatus Lokiarchaeota archaeon]|nr:metallophosphoesterase [Candidatus Lokiarchaeota archaeon]
MDPEKKFTKHDILLHFLSAGINISPEALEVLTQKSPKHKDVEELIREISYIPGFRLHLTLSILQHTAFYKTTTNNHPRSSNIPENEKDLAVNSLDKTLKLQHAAANPKNREQNNSVSEALEPTEKLNSNETQHKLTKNQSGITPLPVPPLNLTIKPSGTKRFKAIARDFSEQIEILKDPSTDLYTSGTIDDFLAMYRDRFHRLKEILYKNPEVENVYPINQVTSRQSSTPEINVIGMVKEKKTSRSGSYIKFTLDDETGELDILVRPDSQNPEIFKKMNNLLNDEVIFVSGYLNVDPQKRTSILFANNIIWPDVPIGHRIQIPPCDISFAMLSDLHIGSENFLENVFQRFIKYLKGELFDTQRDLEEAGRIKYVIICGDLVDGIGVYADQINELKITDIYQQYEKAAELLALFPDYIKVIYIPGNHEPVRKAIPHPAVPSKYCQPILDLGVINIGDPSLVELHGIKFLLNHGDGIIDMNNNIYGLKNNKPADTMKEMLKCRHLSPMYGKECTEKAPSSRDWLVIDQIPHVFHTGHMHINDLSHYNNVLLLNSGCFQAQTKFMKSLGITPTPGKVPIISVSFGKLNTTLLTLM